MSKIVEKIVEPSKVFVGSTFKLKIKIEDDFFYRKKLTTEDSFVLVTEDNKTLRTEWGVEE